MRVAGGDTADLTVHSTAVDPDSWRLVTLSADSVWPDGTVDRWHAQTLQGPQWLATYGEVGRTVPPPVDLEEMGTSEHLDFRVESLGPCPEIDTRPGRVVLATVSHLNNARIDVHVRNANGQADTIETTAPHKFCRLPRPMLNGDDPPSATLPTDVEDMAAHPEWWAAAEDLQPGDRLHTPDGWAEVTAVIARPGTERVYNLTVEHEHLFRVGADAVLVHNQDCGFAGRRAAFRQAKRDVGIPAGQQPESIAKVPLTDRFDKKILGNNGQPVYTREYTFKVRGSDGKVKTVVIQDHSAGHKFGNGGIGDEGPHFNVRPGNNTRNGTVDGTRRHYGFPR